jgi:hypothetical protein
MFSSDVSTTLKMEPPSTQSLFARSWRYLDQGDVYRLLRGRYSPVLALTDSFADPRCILETRGRTLRLANSHTYHDEQRRSMPFLVRLVLGIINVSNFLELRVVNGMASQ